jgi:hypothetical protein
MTTERITTNQKELDVLYEEEQINGIVCFEFPKMVTDVPTAFSSRIALGVIVFSFF